MSEAELRAYRDLAGASLAEPGPRKLGWWGMVLLIVTEAALFATLIAAYFYLRWYTDGGWPPDAPDPKILRPAFYTGALVLSSATLLVAQVGIRRGSRRLLAVGLGATIALALVNLGLQAWDYAAKAADGIVPSTGVFDSLTYVLTGTHAAHVVVGVLILGWVLFRALGGAYAANRRLGVSVAALYWHFVVVLAVVVFVTVVLTPHW